MNTKNEDLLNALTLTLNILTDMDVISYQGMDPVTRELIRRRVKTCHATTLACCEADWKKEA